MGAQTELRTQTADLSERLNAAFFKLLDELTIARSRNHIHRYYKESIKHLGGFPERRKPVSLYPDIDLRGRFLSYDKLNDEIAGYKLSLFNPNKYVKDEFKKVYQTSDRDPFTQADREFFLIGMMKVNFLKRLESSVKSFEITMDRTIKKIENLEKKIRNFLTLPNQNPESDELELDLGDAEGDEQLDEAPEVGGRFKYRLEHLELDYGKNWLRDLKKDKDQLRILFNAAQDVTPETDAKLKELKKLIATKVTKPTKNKFGEPNKKVLVFTAFAIPRHIFMSRWLGGLETSSGFTRHSFAAAAIPERPSVIALSIRFSLTSLLGRSGVTRYRLCRRRQKST